MRPARITKAAGGRPQKSDAAELGDSTAGARVCRRNAPGCPGSEGCWCSLSGLLHLHPDRRPRLIVGPGSSASRIAQDCQLRTLELRTPVARESSISPTWVPSIRPTSTPSGVEQPVDPQSRPGDEHTEEPAQRPHVSGWGFVPSREWTERSACAARMLAEQTATTIVAPRDTATRMIRCAPAVWKQS